MAPPPRGWFLPDRLWSHMDHACAIFLESTEYRDVRIDITRCLTCKYTNANTQILCIHKYSEWWNVSKPYEVLYFWKALDARMSDMIFRVVNHANTKYKYTNTVYIRIPKFTIICTTDGCLTLSPLVSLMYRAKCVNPRVNNSPKFQTCVDLIPLG